MSSKKDGKETIPLFGQEPSANHTLPLEGLFDHTEESINQDVTISYFDRFTEEEPTKIKETYRKKHVPKDVLGEGGMGRVYSAEEPLLHREVAIKTMLKRTTPQSAYWKRFMREAQITAQLAHPAIVPIYGLDFNEENQPFLIMKKIEGNTLTEYIEACKQHDEDDELFGIKARIERLIHVCSAMNYAHNHGVIHRDLKPDNIMVGAFDEMIVMDWGTARVESEKDDIPPELMLESDISLKTMHGALIGTPVYMSPEQAKGESDRVGSSSDLFALGMILFELIELKPGRSGKNLTAVLSQAISRKALSYSDRTPPVIQSIINKATAYDIEDRYVNVSEFAQDLRLYIRGEPVDAHPENLIQKSWRALHKHPVLSLGTLFSLLLCTSFLIIYSLSNNLSHQKEIQYQQEMTAALLDTVSSEARLIDNMLSHILLRLNGLTKAASLKYGEPVSSSCLLSKEIKTHSSAMKLSRFANHYISLEYASCFLAKNNQTGDLQKGVDLGVLLIPDFQSIGYTIQESDDQKNIDSKIQWMYIGTESGVIINYPGLSFFPESYDPRKRPWYGDGKDAIAPKCSNPYPDASGSGYLLPCIQRIETPKKEFVGVAGIDLELDEVIEIIQEYKGFILNEQLEVMLESSDHGIEISSEEAIRENMEKERTSLDNPLFLEELRKNHINGVFYNTQNNTKYAYARLQFAPWTLVLEFDEQSIATIVKNKKAAIP